MIYESEKKTWTKGLWDKLFIDWEDLPNKVDSHKSKVDDQPWNCTWKHKKTILLSTLDLQGFYQILK